MKGMGNMGQMMQQMQKMQRKMLKAQEELHEMTFTASAGGGVVTAEANGKKEITNITIEEDVVDPDDVEMLQDLVIAVTNDVLNQVDEATEKKMGKFTQGMNLPGGLF